MSSIFPFLDSAPPKFSRLDSYVIETNKNLSTFIAQIEFHPNINLKFNNSNFNLLFEVFIQTADLKYEFLSVKLKKKN